MQAKRLRAADFAVLAESAIIYIAAAISKKIQIEETFAMSLKYPLFAAALWLAACAPAHALEGTVTWHDPTCGYFVLTLPGDQEEKFGLFSWRSGADPKMEDVWDGDIVAGEDIDIVNKANGEKMTVIHWANAKSLAQLVRNTPVQCASKWKKKQ